MTVGTMFGRIARRYDLMNSLMTFGMDAGWRKAAVRAAAPPADGLALDLGTGTCRLAAELARHMPRGRVIGVDLAPPMLRRGQAWLWSRDEGARVSLAVADGLTLPFGSDRFDCLTSAFVVRNLPDRPLGFVEQARVVKPGGRVVCLELSWPRSGPLRQVFPLYFAGVVPLIGQLVGGDRDAYTYLPESVRAFPAPTALAGMMEAAGLRDVQWRPLGFGSVTLHWGTKR
jgi:demethylmenaquinone methyltransferase/2-methoxy-6-polyprenyl-1,4-benzoquinol methylase